jgi:ABC-type Zn uptake system ZnuABC Zn-binding protein ZnuA
MDMRARLSLRLTVLIVAPLALLGGCADEGQPWPDRPGPKIVATFPPIYCFAANVAGDDAAVRTAMTTQGPHHFDPKHSDGILVRNADLFFLNGLGLDERAAGKLKSFSANGTLRLIPLGDRIDKNLLEEGICTHDHAAGHEHHDHGIDAHVWLGLDTAELMVAGIREELKTADPARAAGYDRRAAEYTAQLQALRAEGRDKLKDLPKAKRVFVSYHSSMTYFARTFDLEILDVIQKTPGKEPKADELKELVEEMAARKVRVIAVEPQYTGQTAAKRIVEELKRKGVDAVTVELDPLETANPDELTPDWYVRKMRENLDRLTGALK